MEQNRYSLSCLTLYDPMNCSYQAPPSMGFSRQGYWSGLPFPSPADLPDPGIKPRSHVLQADALPSEPLGEHHRIDRPDINQSLHNQCMTKKARIHNKEKQTLKQMDWENWTATWKRMKVHYFFTPCTKLNSKWIKDLHVRPKTIRTPRGKHRQETDIGVTNIFLDQSHRVKTTKQK